MLKAQNCMREIVGSTKAVWNTHVHTTYVVTTVPSVYVVSVSPLDQPPATQTWKMRLALIIRSHHWGTVFMLASHGRLFYYIHTSCKWSNLTSETSSRLDSSRCESRSAGRFCVVLASFRRVLLQIRLFFKLRQTKQSGWTRVSAHGSSLSSPANRRRALAGNERGMTSEREKRSVMEEHLVAISDGGPALR